MADITEKKETLFYRLPLGRLGWFASESFQFLSADNVTANSGSGGAVFATDDISSVHYPRTKLSWGVDGSAVDASASNPLPVVQTGTPALPTGASTLAEQQSQTTALQLIDDAVIADDAAFTPGTTKVIMAGATFDDSAPDSVNEGDAGALRMSANRNLFSTLRDAAGNERGANVSAGNALLVDASATTQPVSAASLPLPSGAATSANQSTANTALAAIQVAVEALDNTVAGSELQVDIVGSLPAGTAAIGKLAANSGVDIGDVDITSVVPGTGATSLGKAEDAAHTSGDVGVMGLAVRNDSRASLAGTDLDYAPLQLNASGDVRVDGSAVTQPVSAASLPLPSGASTEATLAAQSAKLPATLGQKAMTASMAVVLASDQASVPVAATLTAETTKVIGTVNVAAAQTIAVTNAGTFAVQAALTAGTNTNEVVGDSAHDAAIAGNPVRVGMRALTADFTAVATGDTVDAAATILGKQVVMPYALPANTWVYAAPAGGLVSQTAVTAKAAAGAGIINYITSIQVINSHATISTEIMVLDGAAGTVLHRGWAQAAGGGYACNFHPPLRGTENTLVEIDEVTATATTGVLINLQGYVGAE